MRDKTETLEILPVEAFTIERSVSEEFLGVDSKLTEYENNSSLFRLEMNIIEFPMFSKSKVNKKNQIKKYYFSSNQNSYLEIIPSYNETIPSELEERVFIALLKLFKDKGYNITFYCTMSEILNAMKLSKGTQRAMYSKVKIAINKLSQTMYNFKNLFYSSASNGLIEDTLSTNILTYHLLSFKEANETEQPFFSDKRVKDIFKITLSQHFFENIVEKGYLVFDSDELLNIKDSVTRAIYGMITKWRFNKTYLQKPAFFIARRIPLNWKGASIRKTVLTINNSFQELKDLGYIKDFKMNKEGKWEHVEFEIFWDESHNKIKQTIFYNEKANFDNIIHFIEDRENPITFDPFETEHFNNIKALFGSKSNLKALSDTIKEALKKYDYNYVYCSAQYSMNNAKANIVKYFKDTLKNNWAEEIINKKIEKLNNKTKDNETLLINSSVPVLSFDTKLWNSFEELQENEKEAVEEKAYMLFLEESESKDNKLSRGIFNKSKKSFILRIFKDTSIEEVKELKEEKEDQIMEINSPSISNFCVICLKHCKEKGIDFDLENILPVFTMLKEYEDNYLKLSYSDVEKKGVITFIKRAAY